MCSWLIEIFSFELFQFCFWCIELKHRWHISKVLHGAQGLHEANKLLSHFERIDNSRFVSTHYKLACNAKYSSCLTSDGARTLIQRSIISRDWWNSFFLALLNILLQFRHHFSFVKNHLCNFTVQTPKLEWYALRMCNEKPREPRGYQATRDAQTSIFSLKAHWRSTRRSFLCDERG